MRFTVNGQSQDLDYKDVVAAASQIVPDEPDGRHKYYVNINGRRFPVKQLFAEVTGRLRDDFNPGDANRILRRLGFEIQEYDHPWSPNPVLPAGNVYRKHESKPPFTFAVSLESDEDGYIVASCPQLPGCHSQGRTREEAVANIEEAIRGYIASMKHHGEEIPKADWELVRVDP